MAHLKKSAITGHLLKGSGGHLVKTCEAGADYKLTPCFFENPISCTHCSDITPEKLSLYISGVTACTGCVVDGNRSIDNITINMSGWYVLNPSRYFSCVWNAITGSQTSDVWHGTDCTDFNTASSADIMSNLNKTSNTTWTYHAESGGLLQQLAYLVSIPGPADCSTPFSFTVDQGCDDGYIAQSGWTVDVYPGDIFAARCPGGSAVYTDSDLSTYIGKTITITEAAYADTCFTVSVNTDSELADTTATVNECWDDCAGCCDEDATDC